jgi:VanZ family protein
MSEPPATRRRRGAPLVLWALTACAWIGLFIATHIPAPSMPEMDVSDKTLHFTAYFGLASMMYLSTWITNPSRRWVAAIVLAICMVYGVIDEVLQPFVRRHADVGDWLYDVCGAAIAVLLLATVRRLARRWIRSSQPLHRGRGIA